MNVNTTDATTGATALLLPAQNTHVYVNTTDATIGVTALLRPAQNTLTLHDPIETRRMRVRALAA